MNIDSENSFPQEKVAFYDGLLNLRTKQLDNLSDDKNIIAYFAQNSINHSEFVKVISDYSLHGVNKYFVTVWDEGSIKFPNTPALQQLVKRYQEKYSINLLLVKLNDLENCLHNIKSEYPNKYVGIIVHDSYSFHVTPMLVHFNQDENIMEFLCLDTLGSNSTITFEAIKALLEKESKFYYSTSIRQYDQFSCRTSSLLILRNALLHIQMNNPKSIFDLVKPPVNGKGIDNVPPEWDYADQISNKSSDLNLHYAVRDFFSSKGDKLRTIAEFREEKTEKVSRWYKFKLNNIKLPERTALTIPNSLTIKKYDPDKGEIIFKFEIMKDVNYYLIRKGFSQESKLEGEANFIRPMADDDGLDWYLDRYLEMKMDTAD